MRLKLALAALAAAFVAACGQTPAPPAPAPAEEAAAGVTIENPWAAVTPGGAQVAAGYMTIRNNGGAPDRLLSASSPSAGRVEVHQMTMDGAMMKMGPVEGGAVVPANGVLELAPGGYHLMFMDITAPFIDGQIIPVALEFEHAGQVMTTLPVRPRDGSEHGGH